MKYIFYIILMWNGKMVIDYCQGYRRRREASFVVITLFAWKDREKPWKWPFYHYLYTFLFCFSLLELAEIERLSHPSGRLGIAVMKVRQTVKLTVLGRGGGGGGSISSSSTSIS
jgi:hypothetical protein